MQILTKKKLRFRGDDEKVFVSMGGNNIESAPEWIEKDPLFPLVIKDGSLVKLSEAPVVQGSSNSEDKPAEEEKPKAEPVKKAPVKKTAAKKK